MARVVAALSLIGAASAADPCTAYPCQIGAFKTPLSYGNMIAMRLGTGLSTPDIRWGINDVSDNILGETFLDEIDPKTGKLVQSLDLSRDVSVPVLQAYFTGGTGPTEGLMTSSFDGAFLIFGGYNAPLGWSVKNTTSAKSGPKPATWPDATYYAPRVLARLSQTGVISIIAQDATFALGDTLRSTCSFDGNSGYMIGHAMRALDINGNSIPAATAYSPIVYYAGKGAQPVSILNNSLSTSSDDGGNARGCHISDKLTGVPTLYVSAHTKSSSPNKDHGIFQVTDFNGAALSALPTVLSGYVALPGLGANFRTASGRGLVITSPAYMERYVNFIFTDNVTAYVADSNIGNYFSSTSVNPWNYYIYPWDFSWSQPAGLVKFKYDVASARWVNASVIDAGFTHSDVMVSFCNGTQYVWSTNNDYRNASSYNFGTRIRAVSTTNDADIYTVASGEEIFPALRASWNWMQDVSRVQFRGVQWVPGADYLKKKICPRGLRQVVPNEAAAAASNNLALGLGLGLGLGLPAAGVIAYFVAKAGAAKAAAKGGVTLNEVAAT